MAWFNYNKIIATIILILYYLSININNKIF